MVSEQSEKLFKHTGDQYVKANTAFIIVENTIGETHCYRNYIIPFTLSVRIQ